MLTFGEVFPYVELLGAWEASNLKYHFTIQLLLSIVQAYLDVFFLSRCGLVVAFSR